MTDSIIILMSNSIGAAIAVQILSFPCVEWCKTSEGRGFISFADLA
jgi:hypothetical protein